MKKAMKVLCILLCAVLLVVGSVAATLAYLTSVTKTVTNTFSVGNVTITLDEQKYENGELKEGERTDSGNNYHLVPGSEFVKDPTVTVKAGSDASYVRLKVTIAGATWDDIDDYIYYNNSETAGYNTVDWELQNTTTTGTITISGETVTTTTYEFRYKTMVGKTETDTELNALFDEIKIPEDISATNLETVKKMQQMDVVAHAIQAEGFAADPEGVGTDTAVENAWQAFDVEKPNA